VPCDAPDARGWEEARADAESPQTNAAVACGAGATELLAAPTLNGPWTNSTAFGPSATGFPFSVDNPAPYLLRDGSIAVMFRSYQPYHSTIGVARAPDWRGPWTLPSAPIFDGLAEDPTVWYSATTDSYHALFHSLGACADVGCHAFSVDGLNWTLSPTPAYGFTVAFSDGTNTTFARRERPQLVLDPVTNAPTHLINGVQPPSKDQPKGGRGDLSYTLIAPLQRG